MCMTTKKFVWNADAHVEMYYNVMSILKVDRGCLFMHLTG